MRERKLAAGQTREGLSGETQQVKAMRLTVLERSAREFHGYDFLQLIVLGI